MAWKATANIKDSETTAIIESVSVDADKHKSLQVTLDLLQWEIRCAVVRSRTLTENKLAIIAVVTEE